MNRLPIRHAAVAGLFYADDRTVLSAGIAELLSQVAAAQLKPKALIVPHAGYVYSGVVAAHAYALLPPWRKTIHRVILLGPAHRVALRGMAVPEAEAFATPLGTVAVDAEAIELAMQLPHMQQSDQPHADEHSLEVQLPFLQSVLGDFTLVPILVGHTDAVAVAHVIDALWGGEETLIVVSSDLSHYHHHDEARRIDQASIDAILALEKLADHTQACGATPINGLLKVARQRSLTPRLLDLRNSGDTAGDKARVVGYAALAFTETEPVCHVH